MRLYLSRIRKCREKEIKLDLENDVLAPVFGVWQRMPPPGVKNLPVDPQGYQQKAIKPPVVFLWKLCPVPRRYAHFPNLLVKPYIGKVGLKRSEKGGVSKVMSKIC